MRQFLLFTGFLFICLTPLAAQVDSLLQQESVETIYTAGPKIRTLTIDLSNPEEAELVLKKIHTFRYLEAITLDGKADESTLKKLFYRASVLKNLTTLTLRENGLDKLPDNITSLRNLKTLTVEGMPELDYNDLYLALKNLSISELKLVDNDLKKTPASLSELTSLKKILISGSNQLDYKALIDQLAKLPQLTTLSIPVNYISDLPTNISMLKSLQVLDVSNNNLSELPNEISGLKAINNLSIQGNLLIDPAKDLEKLKGNSIEYLALDKEISGEDLEKIKKLFPAAQIDFPQNSEEQVPDSLETVKPEEPIQHSGALKTKKEYRILSPAYTLYPSLFQALVYNFDTLTFEERYRNLTYQGVYQISGVRLPGPFFFRKYCLRGEHRGKRRETWFRFATDQSSVSANFPELRAFSGMYWVYKGPLTKKQFGKTYLKRKQRVPAWILFPFWIKRKRPIRWNDIRIKYSKNNSEFIIELKGDTGFCEFTAAPVFANMDETKSIQTYTKRYLLYQKFLERRASNFRKIQKSEKKLYDLNYKRTKTYAWKELQLRMSDEEKLMPEEEWLAYYDNIIANEETALDNSPLAGPYILRSLTLKGYSTLASTPPDRGTTAESERYRTKMFSVDFVNSDGSGKLAVAGIVVIDPKNKRVYQSTGSLGLQPEILALQQFSGTRILVQLRNGNWGLVSSGEIDKQNFDPAKVYALKTSVFDKNLDTIGSLLESGLK